MGVEVTDAITPSPSPAGIAVRRLRNRPARAASQAYSATMSCTTTNGQNVGFRSVFTAEVVTPVAIPTAGAAGAGAGNVPGVWRNNGSGAASPAAQSAGLTAAAAGGSTTKPDHDGPPPRGAARKID